MGFKERSCGEREGFGRGREDLVFERDGFFEVLFTLDCKVEVRVSDPFDSGVDKGT